MHSPQVIKSGQMKEVAAALEADGTATEHLEETLEHLRENPLARQVARDVALSGTGATANSLSIVGLVSAGSAAGAGAAGFGKLGGEALAKIFGEDVGKEVGSLHRENLYLWCCLSSSIFACVK